MAKRTNVFYDDYETTVKHYSKYLMDTFETKNIKCVALENTSSDIGLFDKSDIIIHYDAKTNEPVVITERIFKRNYNRLMWYKIKRSLIARVDAFPEELGYHVSLAFSSLFKNGIHDAFIDHIHTKDEYIHWAKHRYD